MRRAFVAFLCGVRLQVHRLPLDRDHGRLIEIKAPLGGKEVNISKRAEAVPVALKPADFAHARRQWFSVDGRPL
jgi:hypothetical protein